jgi:hypothetical protein
MEDPKAIDVSSPEVEADVEVVDSVSSADDLKNAKDAKVNDDEEEFDLVSTL